VLKSQTDQPPCFGQLFDDKAPECVGGFDSKWTGGVGGNRVRPTCDFVNACAQKTHQAANPQQVIPTSNLIRPPQPHTTFGTSASPGDARPPTPMQSRAWAPPSQQQPAPPQTYGTQHYTYPTQFAGHYGIPQFLTVRQPVNSGPILERMWWETLRSIGKAIGHTLAHFFDSEVFGRHGGPGPGNSSG
jgi:hypothetical protein